MAERVVSVRLRAVVSEYAAQMQEAANKTRAVGTEAEKLVQKREAFNQLGTAGLAMGAAIAAGIGIAVARFAEFDQAMSDVQAATHESTSSMSALREAALDAGAQTVFSATEAANAIEELAKAGVSTADILGGGLRGALDLAAAGGLGVADAAGIAATSLKMFNLQGDDMSHVADLLAAGAGKAMGDVSDFSQALNQAGLVANQTGLSIEETTAGLAAFAEQGLLGSDAGTSFKSMLQRLVPQSAEAAKLMDQLGVSAYDASGNFVGLANFAGNLQGALKDLTPEQRNSAMATIFGSDAVRAATVIYAQGERGIRDWTDAVDDQGYAAQTARLKLDNLKGDLEELGGAFETALIESGSAANDTLRTMTQALTGLISMYADLPEPVQATVMAVGGATAAIALAGGTAFKVVPQFLEFKATVQGAGMSLKGIGLSAGAAGLALGGLLLVVGEMAAQHQRAQQLAQAYADTIEDGARKIGDSARSIAVEELKKAGDWYTFNWQSAFDAAEKLGASLDTVTDAALGNSDAMSDLSRYYKALDGDQAEFNKLLDETGMSAYELRFALEAMVNGIEHQNEATRRGVDLKAQEERANATATEAAEDAATAYLAEADAADQLNSQLRQLIDRINESNDVNGAAISANARYQEAIAGISGEVQRQRDEYERLNEATDGFVLSLDEATEAGSANADMLTQVASAAREAAGKQLEVDRATMSAKDASDKYVGTLAAQRQAFVDAATEAGFSADQVQALADRIFQLPDEKSLQMFVETAAAQSELDRFIELNNGKRLMLYAGLDIEDPAGRYGITAPGQATGGPVIGPGTGTSDSVIRRLSNGEHVITAAEVQAAGGHGAVEQWRASLTTPAAGTWVPVGGRSGQQSTPATAEAAPVVVKIVAAPKGGINLLEYVDLRVADNNTRLGSRMIGT